MDVWNTWCVEAGWRGGIKGSDNVTGVAECFSPRVQDIFIDVYFGRVDDFTF